MAVLAANAGVRAVSLISWQDRYSVGVDAFDYDHKILVDLINQLHEAYAAGKGPDALRPAFDLLMEYTDKHFEREEALMREHGYPDLDDHIRAHNALREQVLSYHRDFNAGRTRGLFIELLGFLNNWLRLHILEEDMAYKDFFQARGINQQPVEDLPAPEGE